MMFSPIRGNNFVISFSSSSSSKSLALPEAVNLKRLNDLLQINYSQEGFSTGVQVTSLIWHNLEKHPTVHACTGDFCLFDVSKEDVMATSKVNAIIDLILENTPSWLCYGSPRLMRHDLYVLIRNLNIVGKVFVAWTTTHLPRSLELLGRWVSFLFISL